VDLVRLAVGDEGKFIHHSVETKAAGLIVEAFGRGNMPRPVMDAVTRAAQAGVVVVVVSRTQEGRVELSDALLRSGVISGEDLDGLKARILLMIALGATRDVSIIQDWFRRAGGVLEK
jgi:L-asparaginase